jgi:hypothetical protein
VGLVVFGSGQSRNQEFFGKGDRSFQFIALRFQKNGTEPELNLLSFFYPEPSVPVLSNFGNRRALLQLCDTMTEKNKFSFPASSSRVLYSLREEDGSLNLSCEYVASPDLSGKKFGHLPISSGRPLGPSSK